jgi:SpoIID/LytB domain protein
MPGSFPAKSASEGQGERALRRARSFSYGILLSAVCVTGPLQAQSPPRTVRVATTGFIGTQRSLTVATGGAWRLIDLGDHRLVCEGAGRVEWRFTLGAGGRVAAREQGSAAEGDAGLQAGAFRLEGAGADTLLTVTGGKSPRVYPGAVELLPVRRGSDSGVRLINEAPLEAYLTGVVTAEGVPSFHPEALKAIAIAARSYAERNRLRHAPDGEMCDTVHCQVYPGVGRVPEKVAQAVADTAGVVALFGGEVIDAVFSADCGGRTRNSEDVWPKRVPIPYLRSVEDRPPEGGPDYCSQYPKHALRLKLNAAQIRHLLGLGESADHLIELKCVLRDNSGRVAGVQLTTEARPAGSGDPALSDGDEPLPCELIEAGRSTPAVAASTPTETRTLSLPQLRQLLGDQFRGRLVGVTAGADGCLELECRGLGHGVGLCQWGAQGMALPPYNHRCEEILRHYYTGISLGAAPARSAGLLLGLAEGDGQPLAGVTVRLLPGGPAGATDAQGRWDAGPVRDGTYALEARRGTETTTFYALRVTAGKNSETRLALTWRDQGADRVVGVRGSSSGG